MDRLRRGSCFLLVLGIGLLSLVSLSLASSVVSSEELDVVSHPVTLQLPPGKPVGSSPGVKPGAVVVCNRVHIHGVPRLRNIRKYANAVKLSVAFVNEDAGFRTPFFEVCLHRNASIGLGMCSEGRWEKVTKGHWSRPLSPFEHRILDIRIAQGLSSRLIEVTTEEELLPHRLLFLALGIVLLALAPGLSDSVVFYYGSAMGVGIILVILIILFQGMKLLPTGRKSSLAVLMYSSVVGVATFLLHYLSELLRSFLVEIGISEDMHNPLGLFILFILITTGAWLGFWSVRKFVLSEDGSIDTGIANFVKWAIWIFSGAMIVQSSLDLFFALEALAVGILICVTIRRSKFIFLQHLYRWFVEFLQRSQSSDLYPKSYHVYGNSPTPRRRVKAQSVTPQSRPTMLHTSPLEGSVRTPRQKSSEKETFISTFHNTPNRKKFSKEEWEDFTRESTTRAMKELCCSPDFGRWAAENADRIIVTPRSADADGNNPRNESNRWFQWF